MSERNEWCVYVLRCADRTLYTGIAKDVDKRVTEHNEDNRKAARYTRGRRPVELVYVESAFSHSEAAKREAEMKRMTKREKEKLIKSCPRTSWNTK